MTLTGTQIVEGRATGVQTRAPESAQEAQARRVAAEFEALLLTQLTSALRPKNEDEDGGFSMSGSSDLYGQMFGEQMAQVMAREGGVGLAETILKQLRLAGKSSEPPTAPETTRAHDKLRHVAEAVKAESFPEGRDPRTDVFVVSEAGDDAVSFTPLPPATRPRRVFPVEGTGSSSERSSVSGETPHVELRMPVQGTLRSNFGYRRDPFHGHRKYHSGVDIAAPRGTPIGAAADGTVVFSGRDGGYGNCVIIEHADGRRTRYAHASRLHVRVGERVESGQTIADVGSTGRSTGPHLHFEVIEHGRHKNPLRMLINDIALARR